MQRRHAVASSAAASLSARKGVRHIPHPSLPLYQTSTKLASTDVQVHTSLRFVIFRFNLIFLPETTGYALAEKEVHMLQYPESTNSSGKGCQP